MLTILLLHVFSGLLLAVLAIPLILGRIPPNGLYGFRVPKTLRSETIWYAVNRHFGKRLLIASLLFVLGALLLFFIPNIRLDAYALAALFWLLLTLGTAIYQSVRYLNTL
ncbi:MAG: hypothetical protein OHK0052_17450 [Anaerolineales bacterium]